MSFIDDEVKEFILNFTIAGIASIIAKTIAAPLDRVKLLLQNQDSVLQVLTGERQRYKGIIDCLIRVPKEQGFLSFWRGNGVSVIRYFPTQALNFSFNGFYKNRLYKIIGKDSTAKATLVKFLAGGLAGACATAIVYPLEFCQTRICVDVGNDKSAIKKNKQLIEREFHGLTDCLKKVSRADGFRGLYRGFGIAVLGVTFYRAFYFGLFDGVKRLYAEDARKKHEVTKPPILLGLLFAQSVTCISGGFTYPLDTVGRRLMMESGRPEKLRLFHNTLGAFKHMYKHDGGLKSYYKGFSANCLRGIGGALVLVFYDEVLHYTKWKEWLSTCDNC